MSIRARFVSNDRTVYDTDVAAVPEVGESVMLVNLGCEEGACYRVLKREWKMTKYVGFNGATYGNADVYVYVEEE